MQCGMPPCGGGLDGGRECTERRSQRPVSSAILVSGKIEGASARTACNVRTTAAATAVLIVVEAS